MTLFFAARPDFGFGNPNLAAAFFAMLALGVWALHRGQKWQFGIFVVVSSLCIGALILTASRGAIAALCVGGFVTLAKAGVPRIDRSRLVAIAVIGILLLGMILWGRMGERLTAASLEDGSITSRLEILQKVPAMFMSAPFGWGQGNSAEAYHNWFQRFEDNRDYKHLVSMHATWLVETGWVGRWAYIFGWLAVLLICSSYPVALGVWVTLGVAGIFSHIGGDWRLWPIPIAAAIAALIKRFYRHIWPGTSAWIACALGSLGVIALVATLGYISRNDVYWNGSRLTVGSSEPRVWFYRPSIGVLGRAYGKTMRCMEDIGVVWDTTELATLHPQCIVLSGKADELPELKKPYDVIWLNPPARLNGSQKGWIEKASRKIFYWGDLRTDGNPVELKAWFIKEGGDWRDAPGSGLLIMQLPELENIKSR